MSDKAVPQQPPKTSTPAREPVFDEWGFDVSHIFGPPDPSAPLPSDQQRIMPDGTLRPVAPGTS